MHVKRFHDADQTGWITIGMVVLAIILSMVLGLILPGLFGVDTAAMSEQLARDMEDLASSNDPSAVMAATMDATKGHDAGPAPAEHLVDRHCDWRDRLCHEPVQVDARHQQVRAAFGRGSLPTHSLDT